MLMSRVQYADAVLHLSRVPTPARSGETCMRNPVT
jgi:hypothetical protein